MLDLLEMVGLIFGSMLLFSGLFWLQDFIMCDVFGFKSDEKNYPPSIR